MTAAVDKFEKPMTRKQRHPGQSKLMKEKSLGDVVVGKTMRLVQLEAFVSSANHATESLSG